MQSNSVPSLSPGFECRIDSGFVGGFNRESESESDDAFCFKNKEKASVREDREADVNNIDDDFAFEFEFPCVCREPGSCSIPADEIFSNGQIKPLFPQFDRDSLIGNVKVGNVSKPPVKSLTRRRPLRMLFLEDRDFDHSSCSSSETDDLDAIPPETYCEWKPNCRRKGNSTGSSKRWTFPNILRRSNSESRDFFFFFSPDDNAKKEEKKSDEKESTVKSSGEAQLGGEVHVKVASDRVGDGSTTTLSNKAHHATKTVKVGNRRRCFLRQDLVGLFPNINRLSRSGANLRTL